MDKIIIHFGRAFDVCSTIEEKIDKSTDSNKPTLTELSKFIIIVIRWKNEIIYTGTINKNAVDGKK